MKVIEGLRYTKDHEWAKKEDKKVYVGITEHAVELLGDIVYVELPQVGAQIKASEALGVVESVKAASDIYSPVSGKVLEVNEELESAPEKLGEDPYENWIAVLEIDNEDEWEGLMKADEYKRFVLEED